MRTAADSHTEERRRLYEVPAEEAVKRALLDKLDQQMAGGF